MRTPWQGCEHCKIPTPKDPNGTCLFCESRAPFTVEIDPNELDRKILEGRVAAAGDLARSGLKLWIMSFFWRGD